MATFERADAIAVKMTAEIIDQHHPELKQLGVTVDVLYAFAKTIGAPALKLRGMAVAGIARITPPKDRAKGCADAEIQIDAGVWVTLSNEKRRALLDHELTHLEPKTDAEGVPMIDALQRPKLQIRPHDHEVGWFFEVAARHKDASYEVSQATRLLEPDQRQAVFPFMRQGSADETDLYVARERVGRHSNVDKMGDVVDLRRELATKRLEKRALRDALKPVAVSDPLAAWAKETSKDLREGTSVELRLPNGTSVKAERPTHEPKEGSTAPRKPRLVTEEPDAQPAQAIPQADLNRLHTRPAEAPAVIDPINGKGVPPVETREDAKPVDATIERCECGAPLSDAAAECGACGLVLNAPKRWWGSGSTAAIDHRPGERVLACATCEHVLVLPESAPIPIACQECEARATVARADAAIAARRAEKEAEAQDVAEMREQSGLNKDGSDPLGPDEPRPKRSKRRIESRVPQASLRRSIAADVEVLP